MRVNPELRKLVSLMRAANDGDADARRELFARSKTFRHPRAGLDKEATIAELLDMRRHVSPELRFALARWIDGRIALKPGRKPAGVQRAAAASPRLPSLPPELCIWVLLAFGSTSEPLGVHPNTRRALADLLTGARELKRGPRRVPGESFRVRFAAYDANRYMVQGLSGRAAIERAAVEAFVNPGTLQRYMYPRLPRTKVR